ncbi:MAG: nucleoside hydrolase [Candidatus Hodarchaeota archaeon]
MWRKLNETFQLSLVFVCILLNILIVSTGLSNQELETISVIIDSDGAPDDVYAILYLLKHPRVSVRALTLSCGVSYVEEGATNFIKLLSYLGYEDIPVAAGKETPILTNHTFPNPWRQGSYNFYGLDLPPTENKVSNLNASELIVSIVNSSPENITIVALGPLTNVALAIQSNPSIIGKIELLDIMGGALNVPGNVGIESDIPNYEAEWNFYIDPHAVHTILTSDIPILLIPLDATNKVPITEEFQENLGQVKLTPEADIVHQVLTPGLYFWDILTAVALTDIEVVTIQDFHLEVVLDEENHEGETVSIKGEPINAQAAIDADRSAFEAKFLEIINSIETTTLITETSTTSSTTKLRTASSSPTTSQTSSIQCYFLLINVIFVLLVYRSKKK